MLVKQLCSVERKYELRAECVIVDANCGIEIGACCGCARELGKIIWMERKHADRNPHQSIVGAKSTVPQL